MTLTGLVLALGSAVLGMTTLSGQVIDASGAPVAGARVFLEPGLAHALIETEASAEGRFRFEDVAPGGVGLFAIAEGYAFGGRHVHVTVADELPAVTIQLGPSGAITGTVTDFKRRPVEGARVTRVGLLGPSKVGIPLAKLKAFGFAEPVSDADGRFTVGRLPDGVLVVLKVGHARFAQEAVTDVAVGDGDVRVTLYPGVVVRGVVRSRDRQRPVLKAAILLRNAQPPHDTAVAFTDGKGEFALRVKPGVYLYQAAGVAYRTPGWHKLTVTGRQPMQEVSLTVAGVGTVAGKVCDALSGEPIAGARLTIESNGNVADIVRTGAAGVFESAVVEGETIVRLEAAPGYHPPELRAQRVRILESERSEVPTFWLAPIPTYTVRIVDEEMVPAPGVIVQVLRPAQFGWRVTDARGKVPIRVAALPPDGLIVGAAEHPREPLGALFALRPEDVEDAKVQLLPLGSVTGRVVNTDKRALEGAVVGAVVAPLFAEELVDEPLWLWRAVAARDGRFRWDAVVPHVPLCCIAALSETISGESAPFAIEPSGSKDVGNVVVEGGAARKSLQGKSLKWYDNPLLGGALPDKKTRKERPAWVMYCNADDAAMVIESLAVARDILARPDLLFAVVVEGPYACESAPFPVLRGKAPGPATTYLVGADGKVVLETVGMPPVRAARDL